MKDLRTIIFLVLLFHKTWQYFLSGGIMGKRAIGNIPQKHYWSGPEVGQVQSVCVPSGQIRQASPNRGGGERDRRMYYRGGRFRHSFWGRGLLDGGGRALVVGF